MLSGYIQVEPSGPLSGSVRVAGAKNSVLVKLAACVLVDGESVLTNVPASADVFYMIRLLEKIGARVIFDQDTKTVHVDARSINGCIVDPEIMRKMRASVLLMGPLLVRLGRVQVGLPGGCPIGARPIDYHLQAFSRMGVHIQQQGNMLSAQTEKLTPADIVLEYPSVGATENILLAGVCTSGTTTIVNAALEPEVLDLIKMLNNAGARITIAPAATVVIEGGSCLHSFAHEIMPDRLEAGALLLAGAITGGTVTVENAHACDMEVFLLKLAQMGHTITRGERGVGVTLCATHVPEAVSFKTGQYPGFPTDLQAPMAVALCVAAGTAHVHETVHENRLLHVPELQKMGAQISAIGCDRMYIKGVSELQGCSVQATDIRASCALVLAGLVARGTTIMYGLNHWRRGYDGLEHKFIQLGARLIVQHEQSVPMPAMKVQSCH